METNAETQRRQSFAEQLLYYPPAPRRPQQCYLQTSSRAAKIFAERGQPCPRVATGSRATCGQGCPRSVGCGSAALCLCVSPGLATNRITKVSSIGVMA